MIKTHWTASILSVALATVAGSFPAHASDWAGASAGWSSNANPGWNGTGIPNAQGAVANHPAATNSTTTQDIAAGVTTGTISLNATTNNSWTITPTNPITMDQDGAGAGTATISNTNPTANTGNSLTIGSAGAGTITLADNLLISNTGGSTNATGAIQIGSAITGTGNITIFNSGSVGTATGVIRIISGANTFTGNVLVQKGATTYNMGSVFGGVATNVVTLGQSGQGDVTLTSTTNLTLPNNIVVAAGSGGILTFGTTSTSGSSAGYSGSVTLNGNATITSASAATNGLNFTGIVSGAGSITKTGTGIMRLFNAANSYQGGTTISAGTLIAGTNSALGTGAVSLATSTVLTLSATVTDALLDSTTLSLAGTGATAAKLNLLGAANATQETVGGLFLNGVSQADGTYGNTGSGAANILPDYFTGTGILNVVSVPEPSAYAMMAISALGLAGMRFARARRACFEFAPPGVAVGKV